MKNRFTLTMRLNTLIVVCLLPLALIVCTLLYSMDRFSQRYDVIAENVTIANEYNLNFKDEIDYILYIMVVNAERAEELVDVNRPKRLISEAKNAFNRLYMMTDDGDSAKNQIRGILSSLGTLDSRIEEIREDALISGSYDRNMERLELNIRVLTELIQEQIQQYIYDEVANIDKIRESIRQDVTRLIYLVAGAFIFILFGAFIFSRFTVQSITDPITALCDMTIQAGAGDLAVRVPTSSHHENELVTLNTSFNRMMEQIEQLIEDVKQEQKNLRGAELRLLQAQINPHFLYNTLDAIIWLAESGDTEQVVSMVSSLSDFFRTTLSKGRDTITIAEEEKHVRSYLQIQQVRYRDILDFTIDIDPAIKDCQILKLTIQPIVENALYHGIKYKRGKGHIRITGCEEDGDIVIRVRDDGLGIPKERLEFVRKLIKGEVTDPNNTSGFGLNNVNERLVLNYGPGYGLSMDSEYGAWTESVVRIPKG